jgi:hypothetical protein
MSGSGAMTVAGAGRLRGSRRLRGPLVAGVAMAVLAACGGGAAAANQPTPSQAAAGQAVPNGVVAAADTSITTTLATALASTGVELAVDSSAAPSSAPSASQAPAGAAPDASASPAATPMPTITAPPRAATPDSKASAAVRALLAHVASDIPQPYADGCHVWLGQKMPAKPCLYGHLTSRTTIAIYGDSHALAWFPAVLRAVNDKGWRLLNVTMAGCTPADITPADQYGHVLPACIAFRKAALAKLAKYHPNVILLTGTRGFATVDRPGHLLTGTARANAWVAGMGRTIAKLIPLTKRVVLIADTPNSRFANPPACLAAHLSHTLACATPLKNAIAYGWLNKEFHLALTKHVAFVDPERWVCPTAPCPLVRGSLIVDRDHGHMTAKFAASLWRKMEAAIVAVINTPGAVVGP